MEYFVADSYKAYERVGDPFYNKAGKLAIKAKCKCDRCSNGIYATRVENGHIVPHPAYGGVCLKCGGTGVIVKEVRLYTKAEYEAMQKTKARAAEKKEEAMRAGAEAKRQTWLTNNGFDAEGYTYILVGIDSYAIKDELKESGWKYNSFLRWHSAEAGEYAQNVKRIHWSEAYSTTAWGDMNPLPDAQKKIDAMIEGEKEPSMSKWVGEVGDKLKMVPVTLIGIHTYEGRFGLSQIAKFEDKDKNVYTWFTSVHIAVDVGESCFLSGTIKKHDQYKDEKTTVLTRCKIS